MNRLELACPNCRTQLRKQQSSLRCENGHRFPLVSLDAEKSIAALFCDPQKAIAQSYEHLRINKQRIELRIKNISSKIKQSKRQKTLLQYVKTLSQQRDSVQSYISLIKAHVIEDYLDDSMIEQSVLFRYGHDHFMLDKDWCPQSTMRTEMKTIRSSLERCISMVPNRGNAAFLGSGLHRHALEMAPYFDSVWGLESAFAYHAQFTQLQQQAIAYSVIESRNQSLAENALSSRTAQISTRLREQMTGFEHVWCNALKAPFADASFDWMFSIYFTDVLPLSQLIPQIQRLLKPGGYFLHVGPLDYHFKDEVEHYALDEVIDHFCQNGFRLQHEYVPHRFATQFELRGLKRNAAYKNAVLLLQYRP